MKYGKILYNYGEAALHSPGYNLGDGIQTIALENIYSHMNIPDSDIEEIEICKLNNYDGEYVLLPMYSMALGIGFAKMPLSPRIIPVFISTHIAKTELTIMEIDFLKSYAPIGCRDEFSLNTCRRYQIPAYISGCITVTMPLRNSIPNSKKTFFVDTPDSLLNFVPKEISEISEFTTHIVSLDHRVMNVDDARYCYSLSTKQLEKYYKEATLIVSSKQHAIIPCMAAGIPVIAATENISQRFSWFDKYIPIYGESQFSEIDWYPHAVSYEHQKAKIMDLFSCQIQSAYDKHSQIYSLSEFYENRKRANYGNLYSDRLQILHRKKVTNFEYIIWGCGLIGNTVYRIMQKEFPEAKMIAAVDNFVEGIWHGVNIIKPSKLDDFRDKVILLATYSGKDECYAKMRELDLIEGDNFIYLATQNG